MTTLDLPTVFATSATAGTATVNGGWSRLAVLSLTANQLIYVRTDGTAAVVEADFNYAVPSFPADFTIVPVINGGTTSTLSAISSSAAKLYIRQVDGDDD